MYEAIIGLEIHAEMMTASKMFSGCVVVDSVEAEPNSAVDPLSLGMPGTLPVVNKAAVGMAMRLGLAVGCTINPYNAFERKNYFYPDLPKGYQISQLAHPIATNGFVDIELADETTKRIRVRRAHMEEDTGKLTHLEDGTSLVDYNRAGVPLLEIVSEPDMRSAEEALAYATQIRHILRYLGVNSGDMEKGVIRFEANVSIRPQGSEELNTRVEVKNLNSFKALTGAIEYEIAKQIATVEAGGEVEQETLGWNEAKRETYSQRSKEDAHDYRYFPEPDLPPLWVDEAWIESVRAELVELPVVKIGRYKTTFGLSDVDARVIAEELAVANWFEAAVADGGEPKSVANWLINNLFSLMNEHKVGIEQVKIAPSQLVELLALVGKQTISHNTAKEVLAEMFVTGQGAAEIVQAKGLAQISDEGAIAAVVAEILAAHPNDAAELAAGKDKLRGWFVGQIMRALKGKGNPQLVNKLLDEAIVSHKL